MSLVLLLGGQRSGKSDAAERLVAREGTQVVVVTPARAGPGDTDFAARIARHRTRRPTDWTTVETFDVRGAIADTSPGTVIIVDALDTWLLDLLDDPGGGPVEDHVERAMDAVLAEIAGRPDVLTVVVAGQPGLGLLGADASTRRYVDLHGLAVRRLADAADRVCLVVAGRLLDTIPLP